MPKFKYAKKKLARPLEVKLDAGRYKWCGCGRTKKVPWCDGTCKGGKPVRFELKKKAAVEICTCGRTKTPPYCDRSDKSCAKSATAIAKNGMKASKTKGKGKKAGRRKN